MCTYVNLSDRQLIRVGASEQRMRIETMQAESYAENETETGRHRIGRNSAALSTCA